MMKCKTRMIMITGIITVLILLAGCSLFFRGPLGEYLLKPESRRMFAELLIFSLWNFFWLSREKVWHRCAGVLASLVVFLWIHQILVPLLVSGIYLYLISALGHGSRGITGTGSRQESPAAYFLIDFLAGYGIWVVLVCGLSILRLGSVKNLRLVVLVIGMAVFVRSVIRRKQLTGTIRSLGSFIMPDGMELQQRKHQARKLPPAVCGWQPAAVSKPRDRLLPAAAAVIFILIWMIQTGRVNIALDYDSLHYGLRSAYILDNGTGIYENLGNINLVYTYPKGFEILGLPLAGTSTYGYVLTLNLWITALVLMAVGVITQAVFNKNAARLAVFLAAGVPALMNMSVTAKSDNLTLLFQLLCLYGFILCLKRNRKEDFLLAISAFVLTFTLKPTALVFSTVLFGIGCLMLLGSERGGFFKRLSPANTWWMLLLIAIGAWFGTWFRTWKLTGVPITSIYTGIFERMGFAVKAPFAFMAIPANGTTLSFGAAVKYLGTRLYGVLLAPVGKDMAHVNIAWGGGMIAFLILVCIFFRAGRTDREKMAVRFLSVLTLAIGVISLISLYLLWQVDGNYYQLFYILVVLLSSGKLEAGILEANLEPGLEANLEPGLEPSVESGLESGLELILKPAGRTGIRIFRRKAAGYGLIPLFCFQLLVMSLTNWAGVSGFTPVSWKHKGWYNHMEANFEQMCKAGNTEIWNRLAADPATRVIAFGEHPQVLCFPCNIQSYYDVTGSGGNVRLVKKLDYFKEFLRYAGIQYIYVQDGYLTEGSRAEEVIRFMTEDGSLQDILYENGNILGRVVLD